MPKNDTGFGVWLSAMLTEHNVRQSKFADMCNVHRSAVHHWVNDKRIPQRHTLSAIAAALAKITGTPTDTVKAQLLWQCQVSIERSANNET
jgi:transcriptional regulator with XRE-family HTH domain